MNTLTLNNQTLSYEGDASMLLCPLTTFLCSHRVPDGVPAAIHQWVMRLNTADSCVICGNLSGQERYALRLLVERGIPVVLALAQSIPANLADLKLAAAEVAAHQSGRLLIVSPIVDDSVPEATGKSSAARNRLMIDLSTHIVVGFMTDNGNLAAQLLGRDDVEVLQVSGQEQVQETDEQRRQYQSTQMGWAIYRRLKEGNATALPSTEMRQLLMQYLKLEDLQRPSMLHSLLLFVVVRQYGAVNDFNFTKFFEMWGPQNLRPDDWKATKINGKWLPSLAERVMARLFKQLPSRFHALVNPAEAFDPAIAHAVLDVALNRNNAPNERLLKRALNLAYYEHNSEAINYYKSRLRSK